MKPQEEIELLMAALEQIADMDSRDGLLMKETASAAVLQILEARIDARIKE